MSPNAKLVPPEVRHSSGTQPVHKDPPSDDSITSSTTRTRMSERFLVPREALRSQPPEAGPEDERPLATRTAQMRVPESLKLLSLPTPMPITVSAVDIPPSSPLPTEMRRAEPSRSRAREIGSAVALFGVLLVTSALASRLIIGFLFN